MKPPGTTWKRRTEDDRAYIGYGYSITVNQADMGYGGVIEAIFTTVTDCTLITPNNYQINMPNNKILSIYHSFE